MTSLFFETLKKAHHTFQSLMPGVEPKQVGWRKFTNIVQVHASYEDLNESQKESFKKLIGSGLNDYLVKRFGWHDFHIIEVPISTSAFLEIVMMLPAGQPL